MFNYIKETIINDIDNVVVDKDTKRVLVKRGGEYFLDKILDGKIYKTPGRKGQCQKLHVHTDKFLPGEEISGVDYYQILLFISAGSKELSDYALANYAEFGRPIIVETTGRDNKTIADALTLALPNDNPLYHIGYMDTMMPRYFHIEMAEPWMHAEAKVYAHQACECECSPCNPGGKFIEIKDAITEEVPNIEEFATGEWLVENLRFPSYPNRRYNALYADEAPVAGRVYTEYSFQYLVRKATPGGLSGVGQVVDSLTTHVFYVPSDKTTDFENKFSELLQFDTDADTTDSTYPTVSNDKPEEFKDYDTVEPKSGD